MEHGGVSPLVSNTRSIHSSSQRSSSSSHLVVDLSPRRHCQRLRWAEYDYHGRRSPVLQRDSPHKTPFIARKRFPQHSAHSRKRQLRPAKGYSETIGLARPSRAANLTLQLMRRPLCESVPRNPIRRGSRSSGHRK